MSAWGDYKKRVGNVRPWDVLNPDKLIDEKNADHRYAICESCPSFLKVTKQCKECGCFMALKTKIAEAVCPIGKW